METDFGLIYAKELLQVLEPYAKDWHDWKNTRSCFLESEEIVVIENYLRYGHHWASCIELNLSIFDVVLLMKEAKWKLRKDKKKFEKWRVDRTYRILQNCLQGNRIWRC